RVGAAVIKIDAEARGGGGAILDAVAGDDRRLRGGFDFVTAQCVVDVAVGDAEFGHRVRVDIMVEAVARLRRCEPVVIDLRIGDEHRHRPPGTRGVRASGQYAVFIIMDVTVIDVQYTVADLKQNPGAVFVGEYVVVGARYVEAGDRQVDPRVERHIDDGP